MATTRSRSPHPKPAIGAEAVILMRRRWLEAYLPGSRSWRCANGSSWRDPVADADIAIGCEGWLGDVGRQHCFYVCWCGADQLSDLTGGYRGTFPAKVLRSPDQACG